MIQNFIHPYVEAEREGEAKVGRIEGEVGAGRTEGEVGVGRTEGTVTSGREVEVGKEVGRENLQNLDKKSTKILNLLTG